MQTLLSMLGRNPAREAAEILLENTLPVIICTGFPVAGRPETDGPPGAIALADALLDLRRPVSIATYPLLLDILRKIRPRYQTIVVPTGSRATRRVDSRSVLITIEACGETADGRFLNMRGADIADEAPHFEKVFGYHAFVSIGDGGNEFGMGSCACPILRES
jgi:hypothetical protein